MNICFVCNEYPEGPHGGVGTMTQLLAEDLTNGKNSVKVIGVYDLGYPSARYEIKNGVEITRIKVNCKSKLAVLWGNWMISKRIRYWIKNDLIDIIECPDSYGLFSLFAWFGRPFVLRAHGNNTYFSSILNNPLKKNTAWYERNLYKKASGYCAVSFFTADMMQRLFHITDPIAVIHNGIEIPNQQVVESNPATNSSKFLELTNPLIFSGTLAPKKGIYELIKAVTILLNKKMEVTLIINGKDSVNIRTGKSVKSELLELIPPGFLRYFIFNGHVTRNELFYQHKFAKAAIYPSHVEAFALAPMESMAFGVPTVFSKECSGGELITDKEDGLLIDPYSEESIAHSIEYLFQNPERAHEIGQKGKEKIKRCFSKETMTSKTLNFYEQIQSTFCAKQPH